MAAWLLLSLLGAGGEQVIDPFDSLEAWQLNADGGGGLTFALGDGGSLQLGFVPSDPNRWANLSRAVTVPPDAVAVSMRLRVRAASPGAAMYLWFLEADGDGWVAEWTLAATRVGELPRDTWHALRAPLGALSYEPRGNGRREFLTADRMMLGSNYEALEVDVDDLRFERAAGRDEQPLPRSAEWRPEDGPRGRVAVLDEPGLPRTAGAADVERLAGDLRRAGFGVTRLRAGDLADPDRLNRDTFDLLILPQAPAYPLRAHPAVLAYLKARGALLTLGGYAFDRPLTWFGDGWAEVGSERTAANLDAPLPDQFLNTRAGRPGDTMGTGPDQIGLFDPSYPLERVAWSEWLGRRIEGPLEGWVGKSLAGLNSPVFPDQHGETMELGQGYDSLGRPRGALGVVAWFHAGPFAGAAWAGVGVTDRDLVGEGAIDVADLARRLVDGPFLHSFRATPACLRDGEPAALECVATNRGRLPHDVQVHFLADGTPIGPAHALRLEPGASNTVRETYAVPAGRDFVRFEAQLLRDGEPVMTRANAVVVWSPEVIARGPRVRWQDNAFTIDGRPTFLTGTNQTGVMWHSPRENPLTWDRDFAGMADRGMTVWRVLHFSPFGAREGEVTPTQNPLLLGRRPPEETIRKTDALVQLAQKHRVVLMICAHDWIGVELDEATLEAERTWNRFWAERYKDVPGILWDIQNEPTVYTDPKPVPAHIPPLWERFLAELAGDPPASPPALPERRDGAWSDPAGALYEQFRVWLLNRWVAANVAGLREGDPDAIVTVGWLHMRYNADKVRGARGLDFSNMHSYESTRSLAASLRWIDRRAAGQGLSLGEFGSRHSHDARVNGATGVQAAADQARFLSTLATVFGSGGAKACNWCWRDLPDVIFPWGLLRSDEVDRPWAAEMLAATLFTRGVEPAPTAPEVCLLLPDTHRVGPLWDRVDAALTRAFDTLIGLDVPFWVLSEDDLGEVPPTCRLLFWPLPYCPPDATFDAVRRWTAAGGRLYLSGGVGFDPERRPTRAGRYAELGLPAREPRPPFSGGDSEPVTAAVGQGRVTFVEDAPETAGGERLERVYRAVLAEAGARRLAATPDSSEVQIHEVVDRRAGRAIVVSNFLDAQPIALAGEPALTVQVARDQAAMVYLGPDGTVRAALAQGAVAAGETTLVDGPPALVQALDDRPLERSERLLIVPLGAGELRLARAGERLRAAVGEVRGRWRKLADVPVTAEPGGLRLTLGPDLRGLPVLLTVGDPAAAADELVRRLRCEW